jgi:hypothetical protein
MTIPAAGSRIACCAVRRRVTEGTAEQELLAPRRPARDRRDDERFRPIPPLKLVFSSGTSAIATTILAYARFHP